MYTDGSSKLVSVKGQITAALELAPPSRCFRMATILEEILLDTAQTDRDAAVSKEAQRLLEQMCFVRQAENDLDLDFNGELSSLLAQYTYGGHQGGCTPEVLEYKLISTRIQLCSPEQFTDFVKQIQTEIYGIESTVAGSYGTPTRSLTGQRFSQPLRDGNWKSPLDEDTTVEEQWAALRPQVWRLISARRQLNG